MKHGLPEAAKKKKKKKKKKTEMRNKHWLKKCHNHEARAPRGSKRRKDEIQTMKQKCHNHEARASRSSRRRRDEEQSIAKVMPITKQGFPEEAKDGEMRNKQWKRNATITKHGLPKAANKRGGKEQTMTKTMPQSRSKGFPRQ